jgi:hypothetical protein
VAAAAAAAGGKNTPSLFLFFNKNVN